jgi:SAM-dependent methyltransferase
VAEYRYPGDELRLFGRTENWKRYWSGHVGPFVRGNVLEVGAGLGHNTRLLSTLEYSKWVCLEPDSRYCAELDRALVRGRSIDVVSGTVGDLPPEIRFDTVLYLDVLEHIEDDRSEVELACRHLSAGGSLIVLAPAHRWLHSPFDESVGHFRRYSERTLRDVVPEEMTPVLVHYHDAAGIMASMGNRLVLRRRMPTEQQVRLWDRFLVPVSCHIDKVLGYRVGKSIVGVWKKAPAAGR